MRYYDIVITDSKSGKIINQFTTLNSNNSNNGAALQVEVDMFQNFFHAPAQNPYIKITGVTYETISQASNLNNQTVSVSVGMNTGLPLANPQERGIVLQGTIWQAFGNWQGNEVSLHLIVVPLIYDSTKEPNLTGIWYKGTTMQKFVTSTLNQAFPGVQITGNLSDNLKYTEDQPFYNYNLQQFSEKMNELSKYIIKDPKYLGASIASTPNGFVLSDGVGSTGQSNTLDNPTQISYYDIIGNLTWLDLYTIQAKLVMRGDLTVGQYIKFPKGAPLLNTSNTFTQFKNSISFQGVFQIQQIRHVGNSRQADANSWCSIIDAYISQ
jgi:hypothetical protein